MSDATTQAPTRRRLGQVLVDDGIINEDQLGEALRVQRDAPGRKRLGDVLMEMNLVDEYDMAAALARQLGLQRADLNDRPPPRAAVVDLVPRRIADSHDVLPLDFDPDTQRLIVAMADPTNVLALDDLRTIEGIRSVTVMVAPSSAIERAITRAYERDSANRAVEELGFVDEAEEESGADQAGDEPVIRLVNALIADAVRTRASDVHVEPERHGMRVRVRIDGLLRETQQIPRALAPAVTSRLKIMSNLDIAERRRPQDGRAAIRIDGEEVDLRVSTMPSMHGETTVLRLLRKGAERLDIEDLGLDEVQNTQLMRSLARSQGMILMTGPTGSGKTTTLYAGLAELASPVRNVVTLEDPVEYQLPGINQSQMQPKIGVTFAAGLRTILRQDPDVIMVGEIRDPETAGLAVEAAFTGHLVLSTLHTNDSPSTVARLVELGVERFLLSTTLTLIVAQRLARTVCSGCAAPHEPDDNVLEQLGLSRADLDGAEIVMGSGCQRCDRTGYRGRVGLYEFLYITPRLRQLISDGGTGLQLAALARAEGLKSLRKDALTKAMAGVTTLEEVLRVTPEDQFLTEPGGAGASTKPVASARTVAPKASGDASEADETQDAEAAERARAEERAIQVGALTSARVLVVGSDDLRVATEDALPTGWHMTFVQTAAEAQERIKAERPDLLLLDQYLDDGSAFDVLQPLREEYHDLTPAVIHRTVPLTSDELVAASVLGVTDHLDQHLKTDELRARLEAALPL